MEKIRLIIDTDPAIGIFGRDVDDGLAILFLLASGEVEIEGITTNFGNTNVDNAYKIAKDILKITNREDVPVFRGASSKNDLGKKTSASEFLINKVRDNTDKISILALAPLTNIATAIIQDNEFLKNVKELIIMGGITKRKLFIPFEFNFFSDYNSAKIVLSQPYNKTIITADICMQTLFTLRHYLMIKCKNENIRKYIKKNIISWLLLNMLVPARFGFFPWDVVAGCYVIERRIFEENILNFISLTPYGKINAKKENSENIKINIPLKIEKRKFMKLFMERINNL